MKNLVLSIFILIANVGLAMDIGTITGQVVDEYEFPISYASVELLDEKESIIDGVLTDEEGSFTLSNKAFGKYILRITVAGLQTYNQEVDIKSNVMDLGKIILKSEVTELEDVVVRGEVSKVKTEIDKRVIEVGKDLVSAGATASELLNNIPSLNVDQQSGNLTLRGNENVRVFVDGKPSTIPVAQLLKQLPSNTIKKVEIITNPSAKYDPDGNSGIINIVTYKNKRKGYNVSTDLGFRKANRERYNGSINGNVNTGKVNLFGSYSTNIGQSYFRGSLDNLDTGLRQDLSVASDNSSHRFKFGFDWFINDKTELTIYSNQFFSGDNPYNESFITRNDNTVLDISDSEMDFDGGDYSLNFKRNFNKEGHFIEFDGFYSKNEGEENANFNWQSSSQVYEQINESGRDNQRFKVDYTLPVLEKGKLEAGAQYQKDGSNNDFITNQPNRANVDFDYKRQINSAYVNFGYQWEKIGMQLGLRAENVREDAITNSTLESEPITYNNKYNEFYPSAFFTYNLTESDQFSLSFSRRVDRPSLGQVTPIREWQTATMRSIGNQDLKPQFTNSYEIGYLKTLGKKGNINANIFYRKIKDNISRYFLLDPLDSNITLMQYTNVDDNDAYGFELSGFYKPIKWLSMNASFDIFNNTLVGPDGLNIEKTREVENTVWNARLSNDFKLTNSLNLQLFSMFRGKNKFLQGEMGNMFRLDVGLRKSFAKGKGSISARVSDVFNTFYARLNADNPQTQIGEFHWESRAFYIGLNYSFGGKVKTRASKQRNRSESNSGGGFGL